MKNSLCPGILAVVLLSTGSVHAQVPTYPSPGGPQTLPAPAGSDGGRVFVPGPGPGPFPGPPGVSGGTDGSFQGQGEGGQDSGPPPYPPGLSPYINYLRPCGCCSPVGKHGPILYEVYTRHGVSEPIGGGTFGKALAAGYMGQIGGRALFFDATRSWAFTVDVGLTNVWWDAGTDVDVIQRNIPVTFTVNSPVGVPAGFTLTNNGAGGFTASATFPNVRVTPSSLHQIYGNLSAGQEFYVFPLAACCSGDCSWRIGYDAGVRWGTAKVVYQPTTLVARNTFGAAAGPITDVVGLQHGNDVVKGGFFALHTDVEIPYKCCFFYAGLRAEIAHIRSEILQPQNNSNLTMINILGSLGVRF